MKFVKNIFRSLFVKTTVEFVDSTELVSKDLSNTVESYIGPVRKSVIKRFPVLFWLSVTFGLATTYYAFEKILGQYEFLNNHPWVILGIGLSVLIITGTIYKKMS